VGKGARFLRGVANPCPLRTGVRPTQLDGRLGGVAAILLVSSEQAFANSNGVR